MPLASALALNSRLRRSTIFLILSMKRWMAGESPFLSDWRQAARLFRMLSLSRPPMAFWSSLSERPINVSARLSMAARVSSRLGLSTSETNSRRSLSARSPMSSSSELSASCIALPRALMRFSCASYFASASCLLLARSSNRPVTFASKALKAPWTRSKPLVLRMILALSRMTMAWMRSTSASMPLCSRAHVTLPSFSPSPSKKEKFCRRGSLKETPVFFRSSIARPSSASSTFVTPS